MKNELEKFQFSYYGRETALSAGYREYQANLAKAQTRDITDTMRETSDRQIAASAMAAGVVSGAIQEQTDKFLGSQEAIRQEISSGMAGVSNQVGAMRADFNLGFARLESSIDRMSDEICRRLDQLIDITNNPKRTAAREAYRHALYNYRRGFYTDALPDIIEAVEKDSTDYQSLFLEGQIYAFGAGETGDVIDLDKAIASYSKAWVYVKPDVKTGNEDAKRFAAENLFYLGLAQLNKSFELFSKDKELSEKLLADARVAFEQSYRLSGGMQEALFNSVWCRLLQGDVNISGEMRTLIEQDVRYYLKARSNPDFAPVHQAIDDLVQTMRDEEYAECGKLLTEIYADYKLAGLAPFMESSDIARIEQFVSSELDKNLPYIDMRNKRKDFQGMTGFVKDAVSRAKERKAEIERKVARDRELGRRVMEKEEQRLREDRLEKEKALRIAKAKVSRFVFGLVPAVVGILTLLIPHAGSIRAIIGIVLGVLIIFLPDASFLVGIIGVVVGIYMMFKDSVGLAEGILLIVIPSVYTIVVSHFSGRFKNL
jgi:predicted transcriptional regulator